MKKTVILLLLTGIILSGCVNPTSQVPVLKIDLTLNETADGTVKEQEYTITQTTVDYIKRPKKQLAESFPTIAGRVMVNGSFSRIGPWAYTPYKGPGKYTLTIGFKEGDHPNINESIHLSVIVADEKGDRIGYSTHDLNWTLEQK